MLAPAALLSFHQPPAPCHLCESHAIHWQHASLALLKTLYLSCQLHHSRLRITHLRELLHDVKNHFPLSYHHQVVDIHCYIFKNFDGLCGLTFMLLLMIDFPQMGVWWFLKPPLYLPRSPAQISPIFRTLCDLWARTRLLPLPTCHVVVWGIELL